MARRKVLNKADKFYIEQHFGKEEVQEMADGIGCTLKSVKEFIETNNLIIKNIPKPETVGQASAMTHAASQAADEVIKNIPKQKTSEQLPQGLIKINEKEPSF